MSVAAAPLRAVVPMLLGFVVALAFAQDPAVAPPVDALSAARAEYQRLAQEIEKLASRNAWAGVERTYLALVATGVAPSYADHLAGAHAARAVGDVASARQRLLAANLLQEDRTIQDWLWEIDSRYNKVFLACDPGKRSLQPDEMPFDPNMQLAVTFAQAKIDAQGIFDGYLPQGRYTFGDSAVVVEPRVQSVQMDFRTAGGIRAMERQKRKEEKKGEK